MGYPTACQGTQLKSRCQGERRQPTCLMPLSEEWGAPPPQKAIRPQKRPARMARQQIHSRLPLPMWKQVHPPFPPQLRCGPESSVFGGPLPCPLFCPGASVVPWGRPGQPQAVPKPPGSCSGHELGHLPFFRQGHCSTQASPASSAALGVWGFSP